MGESWYDTAQICLNGHTVNCYTKDSPEHNKRFCPKCGAETITQCRNCNTPIQGKYHAFRYIDLTRYSPPSFCQNCGQPYPWTEGTLKAAQELSDEIDNLSEDERSLLKSSLNDIIGETPQATVAATRFKRLVAKAGKGAAEGFKRILVDVLSESARKLLWP